VFAVGLSYFAVVTSLSTILQAHLSDVVRGRVMAIWMMASRGTVPVGVLVAGQVGRSNLDHRRRAAGAVVALLLALYADLVAAGAPDRPRSARPRPCGAVCSLPRNSDY